MIKCLREKCGKEFEPSSPKSKFCSNRCRTYHHREAKSSEPKKQIFDEGLIDELAKRISEKLASQKLQTLPVAPIEKETTEKVKKEAKTEVEQYWQQRYKKKLG